MRNESPRAAMREERVVRSESDGLWIPAFEEWRGYDAGTAGRDAGMAGYDAGMAGYNAGTTGREVRFADYGAPTHSSLLSHLSSPPRYPASERAVSPATTMSKPPSWTADSLSPKNAMPPITGTTG